ncbi:MAG: DUF488 domain-containing protein [Terriglobales bacterium]
MPIALKRAHEKRSLSDGERVLVDRLWPRGVKKSAIGIWLKDLAPSHELRRWFHARPAQWPLFRKRYLQELMLPEAARALDELYELANSHKKVTLLYASRNQEHNNAVVLKELLEGMRKPPHSSGPERAGAGAIRARRSAR